ncbi:MAG: phosphoribosyl-AMP cyclohydrolase [Nitrososphaerota archaeon]|nr:phosphoribosyl-AMP cyclohydrolase [Candidatus Calditenuis fumarioli]
MSSAGLDSLDFSKLNGLVTVVVQDHDSGEVLMVAFANEEAVRRTLAERKAYFWSRSRRKLWRKGEESGNEMEVVKVLVDCDGDALLYLVRPKGPACHTGNRTCFFRELEPTDPSAPSGARRPT